MIATVLWAAFTAAIVGAAVGLNWAFTDRRSSGLGLLFAITLMLLGFSLAAGFSIGRFTTAIPVLLVGAMVGVGRGWVAVLALLLVAAATYLACSWLLTPLMLEGRLPLWLFGAWAIPLYGLLALIGFSVSLLIPPGSARASRA